MQKLCPSVEALDETVQRNVPCLVTGCGRVFAQPAARRLHMVKVHKMIEVRCRVVIRLFLLIINEKSCLEIFIVFLSSMVFWGGWE